MVTAGKLSFVQITSVFCYNTKALDKAKEARRKERILVKQREQVSNGEQVNLDLTYSVSYFNETRLPRIALPSLAFIAFVSFHMLSLFFIKIV